MTLLINFLTQIRVIVRAQDGDQLREWLQVEPGANQSYHNLASELKTQFRRDDSTALLQTVEKCLPEDADVAEGQGTPWPSFVTFMKEYLVFWRDVDYNDLLGAHRLLTNLVVSCGGAFTHPTYGGMLLGTSMSLSESLSRLTMMLNRRPDLTVKLRGGDEDSRKSIAETSAEIIQKIFTTCLTDRSSPRESKPQGKKVGVYMFANLVLKLLFACRRTHLAKQIFTNISTNSPPLKLYPAAQRVTFLYYLGRFNFANNHFLRAALCLQEAYLQTPPVLVSHRTLILSHLIPCNLLLGRLPSQTLFQRPEAQSLVPIFLPIATSIRTGNFILFQQTLATYENWLLEKGLLLTLTHRLRPLLWRSLSRRTFILTYVPPNDPNSNLAATLQLDYLEVTVSYIQKRLEGWVPAHPTPRRPPNVTSVFLKAVSNNVTANDSDSTLVPPPGGPKALRPNEGVLYGNMPVTADDIEMMVLALINQGFLKGYIALSSRRFAIMGAKQKGSPAAAGWPNVWEAIRSRTYEEEFVLDDVPGWVRA